MNKYFKKLYSGFVLKLIATLLLIVGRVMLELGFESAGTMYKVGNVLFYMALPVIYFLAIEGYKHTRSVRNYVLRLLLVAVVAEIVIDLSLYGNAFSKYLTGNNANLFFTVDLGVVMVILMEKIRGYLGNKPVWRNFLTILVIILFMVAAVFLRLEQGGGAILTIAAMYLFYGNPFIILMAVAAIQIVVLGTASFSIMYAPVLGVILTWFYNGKRGYKSIASQAFFYGIYPIVYSIVAMIIKAGL